MPTAARTRYQIDVRNAGTHAPRPGIPKRSGPPPGSQLPSNSLWRAGRIIPLALLLVQLLAQIPGCRHPSAADNELRLSGPAFGTSFTIRIAIPEGPSGQALRDPKAQNMLEETVYARLARLDQRYSLWRPDSQISRLNASAPGTPVPVDDDFARLLATARDVHRASGGAFDPGHARLAAHYGFGPGVDAGTARDLPATAEIARLRAGGGLTQFVLHTPPASAGQTTLVRRSPLAELDLNAIAKGHAVDQIFALLSAHPLLNPPAPGQPALLVEIGGELRLRRALSAKHKATGVAGDRFEVALEDPRDQLNVRERRESANGNEAPARAYRSLRVSPGQELAVATSGNYRQFRVLAAQTSIESASDAPAIGHILDPRTGRPLRRDQAVVQATVVGPDCARADAWATALLVLPPDEALRRIDATPGFAALLLIAEPDAARPDRLQLRELRSKRMANWLD